MRTTTIHPYLLARLIAVQQAFNQPGFKPVFTMPSAIPVPAAPAKKGNSWKDVVKEEEGGDDGQGGGRGSMRGLRGKNAENAKQSMRKLSRR